MVRKRLVRKRLVRKRLVRKRLVRKRLVRKRLVRKRLVRTGTIYYIITAPRKTWNLTYTINQMTLYKWLLYQSNSVERHFVFCFLYGSLFGFLFGYLFESKRTKIVGNCKFTGTFGEVENLTVFSLRFP